MPAPMPGGGGSSVVLPGAKGTPRSFIPSIYSMYGGGFGGGGGLGGGYDYFDPLKRKKGDPRFTRRYDQNEGTPGGVGGGTGQGQPDPYQPPPGSVGQQSPVEQPLKLFGGDPLGDRNTRVERGTVNYDDVWRAYRNQRMFGGLRSGPRSFGGSGFGETAQTDPLKKLLMARFGGM